jgi:hypothetical protein
MDEETLIKNKEKYKERLRSWWKKAAGQRRPADVSRMEAEIKRDRERLFAVCRERADGVELADCILRLTENAYAYAHYAGIRRGYKIGLEVGKDVSEEKIIQVISKKLDATPTEMCELIDAYNAPFEDLKDKRCIRLDASWPEMTSIARWKDVASVPKVKNYLVRARNKAYQVSRIEGWQRIMREHEKNRK